MRRFLLLLSAILLAVLSVPLFAVSSVNAASIYDNFYRTTDELVIQGGGGGGCSATDITSNWTSYITDESKWWIPNQGYNDMLEDMLLSWNNKERWGVSVNNSYSNTSSSSVYIYWTEDDSLYMNWESGLHRITTAGNNVKLAEIRCGKATYMGAPAQPIITAYGEYGSIVSTDDTGNTKNLFFYGEPSYPQDYEGDDVRSSLGPETIRPRFIYDIVDRDVTATHMPRSSALPTYPNDQYSIEWFVRKCLDWDDVSNSCSEYEENNLHYEITPSGGTTSFQVPSYGHYKISAGYLIGGCTRYPSYPATPDYCYYTAPANTDEYEYTITAMMWDVDGSSFSGDTDDDSLICDVSGFCETPPFNCADVYSDNFVMRLSCSMQQDMDFGLVNPSLFAIKDLMQSMTVPNNPQCDIPLTNVSLASGYTFPLSSYSSAACAKAAEVRTAIPILSVFLNFMLAMLSIWMVVRIINKLFDEKDHNIIEGV